MWGVKGIWMHEQAGGTELILAYNLCSNTWACSALPYCLSAAHFHSSQYHTFVGDTSAMPSVGWRIFLGCPSVKQGLPFQYFILNALRIEVYPQWKTSPHTMGSNKQPLSEETLKTFWKGNLFISFPWEYQRDSLDRSDYISAILAMKSLLSLAPTHFPG